MKTLATIALFFALIFPAATEEVAEKELQKSMKEIGDIAKRFKKNVEEKKQAAVVTDSGRLAELYHGHLAFWKNRKTDDALKWTQDSEVAAKAIATSAKAGDWEKTMSNLQSVMKNCKNCHEAHREKVDEGVYRIK